MQKSATSPHAAMPAMGNSQCTRPVQKMAGYQDFCKLFPSSVTQATTVPCSRVWHHQESDSLQLLDRLLVKTSAVQVPDLDTRTCLGPGRLDCFHTRVLVEKIAVLQSLIFCPPSSKPWHCNLDLQEWLMPCKSMCLPHQVLTTLSVTSFRAQIGLTWD